jgi:O-succinylbenzoate synthase
MVYTFQFKHYRLPLRAPLRTAHGLWKEREGIIVRLEDTQGRAGFGEIAPIPWFGTETLPEAAEICGKLGTDASDEILDAVPTRFGCVRFAIAQALRLGSGQALRQSSGQAREKPGKVERGLRTRSGESSSEKTRPEAAFHHRLPVAALLPAGKAALLALREKLEAGFLAFKWKVGVGAVEDELGLLDDLLAQLPTHAKLRLDANGAWNRRDAGRWLVRCADRPVEFVEQPVAPAEEDALLGLAADYPVTLALDESVVRLDEARRWQGLGWPGVFVIKPALAGPLDELADWIAGTKADVVISSAIETVLGRSAVLEAVLSQPLTKRALGFGTGEIFGDRRWDGPVLGPLADASCVAHNVGEDLWTALV